MVYLISPRGGSLSDDASWAAFEFAPYARMRLSLAIRRALARALRETACTDAEAAALRGRGAADGAAHHPHP